MDALLDSALNRLQSGYRLLFERHPMPMLVVNLDTLQVLAVNEAAARFYGYPVAQFTAMHLPELYLAEDLSAMLTCMARRAKDPTSPRRWRQRTRDGRTIHVDLDGEDLSLHGLRVRMLLVHEASALQPHDPNQDLHHARLDAIIDTASDIIITTDAQGLVQTFNPAAQQVFGYSAEQMVGQSIERLLPERYRTAHVHQRTQFAASDEPPRMMGLRHIKGQRANGQEVSLEGSIAQVRIGNGKTLICTLRDVTARDQALREREAAREQLSQLTWRLMSQEKAMVKRMAQALHDQLGQTTAAIRIVHETMGMLRRGKQSAEYLRLDQQLGKLIDQATRQVRMVLVELHPPLLDDQGLAAALDNELRSRALTRERMNFVLQAPPAIAELRWPAAVEYGAFMVAREAIENALRHAGATQITVQLSGTAQRLEMDVADNGRSIAPGSHRKPGHLGITGMLKRAHSIGGTVMVGAIEAGGTRVSLRWSAKP